MDACIFFILFIFFFPFLSIASFETNCPTLKCGDGEPDIRFPFRISEQQPQHCGRPGFELSCKENTTTIHFPAYGDMVVKSISYKTRRLQLLDPKNCVHEVFLNLNLSLSQFRYYYVVKNYNYLNCSTRFSRSSAEVSCLSGSDHHVYTVEPSVPVPNSCRPVKTVAIPFAYSPYLADNSFGLGLTWSLPGCEGREAYRSNAVFQTQNEGSPIKHLTSGEMCAKYLKILLCILAATTLVIIKIHHSKRLEGQTENQKLLEVLRDRKAPSI